MQQQEPQDRPLQSIRKRARKACQSCKRRKRRCDGAQPCRSCVEYEYDCHFDPTESATSRSESLHTSTNDKTSDLVPSLDTAQYTKSLAALNDRNLQTAENHPAIPTGPELFERLQHMKRSDFPRAVAQLVYGHPISPGQDFGFNIGTPRMTVSSNPSVQRLATVMSLEKAEILACRFCDTCGRLFPVIGRDSCLRQLRVLWQNASTQPACPVEVAITFAVLLGSYFSWPHLAQRHDALMLHALEDLDRLTFRQSTRDHWLLRAWVLKTLLLRSMAAPDAAWLSSCNMMHVTELLDGAIYTKESLMDATTSGESDAKNSIFGLAWILHQMISLEGCRSTLSYSTIAVPTRNAESSPASILRLLPKFERIHEFVANRSNLMAKACLLDLCHQRTTSKDPAETLSPHASLIEACIVCGIYRRTFRQGDAFEPAAVTAIKRFLEKGLNAAESISETDEPWFMLAEFPAQAICVCLALGSPLLALLPSLIGLLDKVTRRYKSVVLCETERTIALLLEAYLNSRDRETSTIRAAIELLSHARDATSQPGEEDLPNEIAD